MAQNHARIQVKVYKIIRGRWSKLELKILHAIFIFTVTQ